MWNQISTPNFAYQNDQRNKIYTLGDFENKTPTHMAATYAISKSERLFQNRIPRKLDKNFYIPKISMIHLIGYNFLKYKNRSYKKVMSIPTFWTNFPNIFFLLWIRSRLSLWRSLRRCEWLRTNSSFETVWWRSSFIAFDIINSWRGQKTGTSDIIC